MRQHNLIKTSIFSLVIGLILGSIY